MIWRLAWTEIRANKKLALTSVILFALPILATVMVSSLVVSNFKSDPPPSGYIAKNDLEVVVTNTPCEPDAPKHYLGWCVAEGRAGSEGRAGHADLAEQPDVARIAEATGLSESDVLAYLTPQLYFEGNLSVGDAGNAGNAGAHSSNLVVSTSVAGIDQQKQQSRQSHDDATALASGEIQLDEGTAFALGVSEGDTVHLQLPQDSSVAAAIKDGMVALPESDLKVTSIGERGASVVPVTLTAPERIISGDISAHKGAYLNEIRWVIPDAHADGVANIVDKLENADYDGTGIQLSRASQTVSSESVLATTFSGIHTFADFIYTVALIGLMLLVVSSVVAPLFAISARRSRRRLGLLAVTGARPSVLRNVMLAYGVIIGLLGCALAIVLSWVGIGIVALLAHDGSQISWAWDMALASAVAAVLVGLLAASWPAKRVSSDSPILALADGTNDVMPHIRPWHIAAPVVALVAFVISSLGVGNQWTALFGVIAYAAWILSAPWLVLMLGKFAGKASLPVRLAAREQVRNLVRSSAAVAAVTATVIALVASALVFPVMSSFRSTGETMGDDNSDATWAKGANYVSVTPLVTTNTPEPYEPDIAALASRYGLQARVDSYVDGNYDDQLSLAGDGEANDEQAGATQSSAEADSNEILLPAGGKQTTRQLNSVFSWSQLSTDDIGPRIVGEEFFDALPVALPGAFSERTRAIAKDAYKRGEAVVTDASLAPNGKVNFGGTELPAVVLESNSTLMVAEDWNPDGYENTGLRSFERVIISPATAAALDAQPRYQQSTLFVQREPDVWEKLRASVFGESAGEDGHEISDFVYISWQTDVIVNDFSVGVLSVLLVLSMGVILLIVLLSAAEVRRDIQTMYALGARPGVLRKFGIAQALSISLLGIIGGLIGGSLPFFLSWLVGGMDGISRQAWQNSTLPVSLLVIVVAIVLLLLWSIFVGWLAGRRNAKLLQDDPVDKQM